MIRIAICSNICGAGKTTVANYLEQQHGFKQLNFADGIYDIAEKYFGMEVKDRGLLIQIGEKLREIDEFVWVKHILKQIQHSENVVIGDMRKTIEYDALIKENFYPIRICCPRDVAVQRLYARDGTCDLELLDSQTEIETRGIEMEEIENNGSLEDLYQKIDKLIERLW